MGLGKWWEGLGKCGGMGCGSGAGCGGRGECLGESGRPTTVVPHRDHGKNLTKLMFLNIKNGVCQKSQNPISMV